MTQVVESGSPTNLTETGTVSKVSGTLLGFYVNSTSSGTIVFKSGADGTASGAAISGTITPAVGFHRFSAYCPGGCHATIADMDVTVFFAAG